MKRALFGLVAAAVIASTTMAAGGTAWAAPGDEIIVNGDFSNTLPDGSLVGATTDFALADNTIQGNHYAGPGEPLSMWDEGTYVVGTNPNNYHVLWVNQPNDNPKMIVNGFTTSADQVVWQQSDPGVVCPAGNQVTYDFSATVANILPLDAYNNGGAAITVNINGVDVANVDLTSNDPANPVVLSGNSVPALATMTLTIKNGSTVKIGNDFSLDNISLKQVGGCQAPVAAVFDVNPTAPTCDAAGSLDTSLFPIVRDGYTLTVDRAFDGPGDYVITATPDADHFIDGDATKTVTVLPRLTGEQCNIHVTAQFPTPVAPTCTADGSLPGGPFPADRVGYTLSISPAYTGPGVYTLTATAKAGYTLDGATTSQVTVLAKGSGLNCAPPAIGGRTIGFWSNKNGIAAATPTRWAAVRALYPNALGSLPASYSTIPAYLLAANNTTKQMLTAQFIATALNTQYLPGYGGQYVAIPQAVATSLGTGTCITVTALLSAVNAHWADFNTQAKWTPIKTVLDNINQDTPLVANQCTP